MYGLDAIHVQFRSLEGHYSFEINNISAITGEEKTNDWTLYSDMVIRL